MGPEGACAAVCPVVGIDTTCVVYLAPMRVKPTKYSGIGTLGASVDWCETFTQRTANWQTQAAQDAEATFLDGRPGLRSRSSSTSFALNNRAFPRISPRLRDRAS